MENRHLWLRSTRQHAVLRVRSEVEQAIRDFFYERDFTLHRLADPHAGRLRGDLDPVRDRLLRRQGLPLAVRPALPRAGGRGVRQGLLLRADLPRREVEDPAPPDGVLDGRARGRLPRVRRPLRRWPRSSSSYLRRRACSTAAARSSKALERDTAKLERGARRPSRASPTREAIEMLNAEGHPDRSGATTSAATRRPCSPSEFDRPVMVSRYPAAIKAFYMQPDPDDPDVRARPRHARARGLRRDHRRQPAHPRPRPAAASASSEHNLPIEAFQWYLDVRKYGTFPHSGFGMGIERFVAWMCGVAAPARDDSVPAHAVQDLPLERWGRREVREVGRCQCFRPSPPGVFRSRLCRKRWHLGWLCRKHWHLSTTAPRVAPPQRDARKAALRHDAGRLRAQGLAATITVASIEASPHRGERSRYPGSPR